MKYIVKKEAEFHHVLKTAMGHGIADCHGGEDLAHKMAATNVLFDALKEIEESLRGAGHSTSTPEQCAGGTCHYCAIRRRCWDAIAAATLPLSRKE